MHSVGIQACKQGGLVIIALKGLKNRERNLKLIGKQIEGVGGKKIRGVMNNYFRSGRYLGLAFVALVLFLLKVLSN